MYWLKISGCVLGVLFGIFLFFFGGYDDSPGAQGLGLIIVALNIYAARRTWKAAHHPFS